MRLRAEKEIIIIKQIKIIHPTDLVLLPYIGNLADQNYNGEIWQMKAEGGTGHYKWGINDTVIASISGTGLVKSR
jgi:hypothetical protein